MEDWKDIVGYAGLYQVNSLGQIKGHHGKLRKPQLWNGYELVVLCNNTKRKSYKLHRLIAEAFIPNPQKKPQINHKNGIKSDNRVENLEWVTESENCKHRYHVLKIPMHRQPKRPVIASKDGVDTYFESLTITRSHGFEPAAIYKAIDGRTSQHGGYKWRWA